MSECKVVAKNDTHRVCAVLDPDPTKPEFQGYPEVIISDDKCAELNSAWNGSTQEDTILRAFRELSFENFCRWIKIFEDDLVVHSEAGIPENEFVYAHVSKQRGYSQGDVWVQIVWSNTDNPDTDYVSDLVNWARGDMYSLSLQKLRTFISSDSDDDDSITIWDETESVYGYASDDPLSDSYIIEEAERMLKEAK